MTARAACCAWLLLAAGCATMRTSHEYFGVRLEDGAEPLTTLSIENYGWFLFDSVPLICGDPSQPNANACKFFTNTVTLENNIKMLTEKARAEGVTEMANVVSRTDSSSRGGFWIFYRRLLQTSAIMIKPRKAENENSQTRP